RPHARADHTPRPPPPPRDRRARPVPPLAGELPSQPGRRPHTEGELAHAVCPAALRRPAALGPALRSFSSTCHVRGHYAARATAPLRVPWSPGRGDRSGG